MLASYDSDRTNLAFIDPAKNGNRMNMGVSASYTNYSEKIAEKIVHYTN